MIEFRGEISENCRRYVIRKERKMGVICATIVASVFSIPIITLAITWDWIFVIAIPVLILAVAFAVLPPKKKSYPLIFPDKIIIDKELIESKSEKFHVTKSIDQVKKVVDMGEWFHIFFYDRPWNSRFICQKDLLKQGTIEEFESLFDGKIEVRTK